MPHRALPPLPQLQVTLTDAMDARSSCRESSLSNPLSLEELGTVLGYALGSKSSSGTRRYASGGGLFPLEAYIIVNNVRGLERHVYHYDPDAHALDDLWPVPDNLDIAALLAKHEWAAFSSCILVFTCVWGRTRKKYGDFSYLLSLIESGGAGHNVALIAAALELCACPIAGFDEVAMAELLDTPSSEQALYTIALGKRSLV